MKNCLLFCLLLAAYLSPAQSIYRVDANAQGANTGLTWADAFTDLHDALQTAVAGDQIWVAIGTYKPTQTTDRSIRFELKSGVKLYGSFAGTELTLQDRGEEWSDITTLDGDIGVEGDTTDNAYNLLYMRNPDSNTVVDRFYFTHAQADDMAAGPYALGAAGGAVYVDAVQGICHARFEACSFFFNTARNGGGLCINGEGGDVAPILYGCNFWGNHALQNGGGMCRIGGSSIERGNDFTFCFFSYNVARNGGGLYVQDGPGIDTLNFVECNFSFNEAVRLGGGFCSFGGRTDSHGSSYTFFKSDFTYNRGFLGAGFSFYSEDMPLKLVEFDSCNFDANLRRPISATDPNDPSASEALLIYTGYYNGTNLPVVNTRIIIDRSVIKNHKGKSTVELVTFLDSECSFTNSTYKDNTGGLTLGGEKVFFENNYYLRNKSVITLSNFTSFECVIKNNVFAGNEISSYPLVRTGFNQAFYLGNAFVNNKFATHPSLSGINHLTPTTSPPTTFINNIFWNNRSPNTPQGTNWVVPFANDTIYFYNNIMDSPTCVNFPSNYKCMSGNLFMMNPQFENVAWDSFRLQSCSPAINAGLNSAYQQFGILTDIEGRPRIGDGVADIGPFESSGIRFFYPAVIRPTCTGKAEGSVSFSVENGCAPYVYSWSNGVTTGTQPYDLSAGEYHFSITDQRGRMLVDTVTINASAPIGTIVADPAYLCEGATNGALTISAVSGFPPYAYGWLSGQTTAHIDGLGAGNYGAYVLDVYGCFDSVGITLATAPFPTVDTSILEASCALCANGVLEVTVQGGIAPYQLQWSNGATTERIEGLLPGEYQLTVTDAAGGTGCTYTYAYTVPWVSAAHDMLDGADLQLMPNPVKVGQDVVLAHPVLSQGQAVVLNALGVIVATVPIAPLGTTTVLPSGRLLPGTYEVHVLDDRRMLGQGRLVVVQ